MDSITPAQQSQLMGYLLMALLLAANAFFVAVEFAVITVRRSRIQEMLQKGNPAAKVVQSLQKDIDTTVAGAQLGITLASLALGWVAEENIHRTVNDLLHSFAATSALQAPHGVGVGISFVLLSMMHVILGEQVPKSWALRCPEEMITILVWPFNMFCTICRPLISLMNYLASVCLRVMSVPKAGEEAHTIGSPDEFAILFEQSRIAGFLQESENKLLQRALEMREHTVDRLMVQRSSIEWLDVNDSEENLLEQVLKSKHSRIPIADGELDHILGYVRTRNILADALRLAKVDFRKSLVQPVYVPHNQNALLALQGLGKTSEGLAIVLDEFGGVQGLFTLNDIVGAAFGDLAPMTDSIEEKFTKVLDDEWIIDGLMSIEEFVDLIGASHVEAPEGRYHTVAGLVISNMGRIPEIGETCELESITFEVLERDGYRVARLKVKRNPPQTLFLNADDRLAS